ncbi:hypothetical protein [Actinoplanes sp. L3-i22]|uniref:hypothetical protein n=1 Tax=Actinoplanes sp. L3-i22 TaxID=2836373 RepID=UPI001C84350A|nr:hypothetical protein [Actinoplanes sp. L3-i22]
MSRLIAEDLHGRGMTMQIIKIALPLYRLQQHLYASAGRDVDLWTHDNELLRVLATQLRRINPDFLADDFLTRTRACCADVVINDDLRDTAVDYPRLVADGFCFLGVRCDDDVRRRRLTARADITIVADSADGWGFHTIRPHWSIDNSADDRDDLCKHVSAIVDQWLDTTASRDQPTSQGRASQPSTGETENPR